MTSLDAQNLARCAEHRFMACYLDEGDRYAREASTVFLWSDRAAALRLAELRSELA
jgi:hypothetical protein